MITTKRRRAALKGWKTRRAKVRKKKIKSVIKVESKEKIETQHKVSLYDNPGIG